MSDIPRDPARFFTEYLPGELARLQVPLGGGSSDGAVAFELVDGQAWSLRLERGSVAITPGVAEDTLVRISVARADFEPIIVGGAERLGGQVAVEREVVAARVLTVDRERAQLLRDSPGTIAVQLAAPSGAEHRLFLTLGAAPPKLQAPDCELRCALEDLWAIQAGTKNAFELLMEGKLAMSGKVELAMALGGVLG